MSPWTSLGIERSPYADPWPVGEVSLIVAGDDSDDARVLAMLLARATDGTVLSSSEGLAAAGRRRPGLLVVRSAPRGARSHDVDALVRNSFCPVAVAPAGYAEHAPGALRRIGVAFDGRDESRIALTVAVALGERADGELVVLMVSDPHSAPPAQGWDGDPLAGHRTVAARYLTTVVDELSPRIEARARVLDGPVAPALATACTAEQLDLLALGSRRRGPLARIALGSVSSALLHRPPACPLLVCPRAVTARREGASVAD